MLCRNTSNAKNKLFLNSNSRRDLNFAFFFWVNTRHLHLICRRFATLCSIFIQKRNTCSEKSVHKIQTTGIRPKEGIQELEACIKGNGGPVATRSTHPKESPALHHYHYTHLPRYDDWQLL